MRYVSQQGRHHPSDMHAAGACGNRQHPLTYRIFRIRVGAPFHQHLHHPFVSKASCLVKRGIAVLHRQPQTASGRAPRQPALRTSSFIRRTRNMCVRQAPAHAGAHGRVCLRAPLSCARASPAATQVPNVLLHSRRLPLPPATSPHFETHGELPRAAGFHSSAQTSHIHAEGMPVQRHVSQH